MGGRLATALKNFKAKGNLKTANELLKQLNSTVKNKPKNVVVARNNNVLRVGMPKYNYTTRPVTIANVRAAYNRVISKREVPASAMMKWIRAQHTNNKEMLNRIMKAPGTRNHDILFTAALGNGNRVPNVTWGNTLHGLVGSERLNSEYGPPLNTNNLNKVLAAYKKSRT
jgi:hypothetical protein